MNNYDFLADDLLVDALLLEAAGLLQNLLAHGKPGSIDLMGLPLSPICLAALDDRLGTGEVTATLHAAGQSQFRETAFPGIWWTRHEDESGRLVAQLIEVALIPEILCADAAEIRHGLARLTTPAKPRLARHGA
jgi:hydrogenase-1 operon protein HyaF